MSENENTTVTTENQTPTAAPQKLDNSKADKKAKKAEKAKKEKKPGDDERWVRVIAVVLAIALVVTIIVSNYVSITAISVLKSAANSGTVISDGTQTPGSTDVVAPTAAPGTPAPTAAPGTPATTAAPGTPATTAAPGTPATTAAPGTPATTAAPAAQGMTKEQAYDIYKKAVEEVKNNGSATYTRKEWQSIDALQLGSGSGGDTLKGIIEKFVTKEADAKEYVSEKGSDDSKNRFPSCGAPISKVASATCTEEGGNYKVTIVMNDEVTPTKGSDGIASMSTGILYMEDVVNTIQNDSTVSFFVKGLEDGSGITYKAYTITATITKDNKFVEMKHVVSGDIVAKAKLVIGSISGTGTLTFNSSFYNFSY